MPVADRHVEHCEGLARARPRRGAASVRRRLERDRRQEDPRGAADEGPVHAGGGRPRHRGGHVHGPRSRRERDPRPRVRRHRGGADRGGPDARAHPDAASEADRMADHLWSPWRMEYIQEAKEEPERRRLRLLRDPGDRVRARPRARRARLRGSRTSSRTTRGTSWWCRSDTSATSRSSPPRRTPTPALLQRSVGALRRTSEPHGFNIGLNLGRIGGRGHPGAPALARGAALERRHELHAGRGRDAGAAGAARRDVPTTRTGVRRMSETRIRLVRPARTGPSTTRSPAKARS